MANIKSNIKSKRQDDKVKLENKSKKAATRTLIKKANVSKKPADLNKLNKSVSSLASKGIIHKNKAARIKSRTAKKAASK